MTSSVVGLSLMNNKILQSSTHLSKFLGTRVPACGATALGGRCFFPRAEMAHRRRRHVRDDTLSKALDTVEAEGLVCAFPPYRHSHGAAVNVDDGLVVTLPRALDSFRCTSGNHSTIDWPSLPPGIDPTFGDLEGYRAQRKREQVESLAKIVCSVARPGDRIVEFGAGSGHLGLLLAHLLPLCHVVLVERKAFRAGLAMRRIAQAGLPNVELCAADAQQYARDAIEAAYGRALRADKEEEQEQEEKDEEVEEKDDDDDESATTSATSGTGCENCRGHAAEEDHTTQAGGSATAAAKAAAATTLLPLDPDEQPLPAGARGEPFQLGVGLHTCGLLTDVRCWQDACPHPSLRPPRSLLVALQPPSPRPPTHPRPLAPPPPPPLPLPPAGSSSAGSAKRVPAAGRGVRAEPVLLRADVRLPRALTGACRRAGAGAVRRRRERR